MKVSIDWLKELVNVKDINEVIRLLPLHTIGTKEITENFIELDMKGYNRADLLSMRGVAMEVAAITGSKVKFEETNPTLASHLEGGNVKVEIENSKLCPLYCVAKIEGLRVGPSSQNCVKKLVDCGIRKINNIADVTNLVMLEYGQPLHAFDAKAVKDETIVVRTAKQGERITTLDRKTRDLEHSDLLIADPQNNLGIAGVMGGKDSEISDTTTTILLEAAIFDPSNLRKTSTRLNLQSEASKRFYHGLTKKRLMQALSAAIKMYEDLGGKLVALTVVGHYEDKLKSIELTKEKLNSLIGVEISEDKIEDYLHRLNFICHPGVETTTIGSHHNDSIASLQNDRTWNITPPYWRLDINIEEDLVEEVARMYGYEKIPAKELSGTIPPKIDQSFFELTYKLKTSLADAGLTEIQTYSFYSTQIIDNLQLKIDNLVKVANPISSETEYLRRDLWPNLLEKLAQNLKQGFEDVAIFEIGKVYHSKEGGAPDESYRLSIALSNGTDNPIQELYQILQKAIVQIRHSGLSRIKHGLDSGVANAPPHDGIFHPKRWTSLTTNGQKNQGILAEVHPRVVNRFGVEKRVAVLELELESNL